MTISFFSNFINHHQVWLSEHLYNLMEGNYTFVEIIPMPESFRKTGYPDFSTKPYVLQAWKNAKNWEKALNLAEYSDVALFDGYESLFFEKIRSKKTNALSFEVNERWCKKGVINFLSPRFIKWYLQYLFRFRKCNTYKLCCSAYLPNDMYHIGAFKNKCYKWAYFTKVEESIPFDTFEGKNNVLRIMWCSRFIDWKHPEMPIILASRLKEKGYSFTIDMYGGGILKEKMQKLVRDLNVSDVVHLQGNLPNEQILCQMRKHQVFLFTSDRNEGWGAVVNEALSNGCVVIGDEHIGSIPFLVTHNVNGRIYKTKSIDSLEEQVIHYFKNPDAIIANRKQAYEIMHHEWTPEKAALKLIKLIKSLKQGQDTPFIDGPCSKAYPI